MAEKGKSFEKETAFRTLELTNSWISNVDTKISFALAFAGVMIGFIFSKGAPAAYTAIRELETLKNITGFQVLSAILVTGLYFASFMCVYCLLRGISAKVKNVQAVKSSLFFFGTITERTVADYKDGMLRVTDEDIVDDLLEQIHTNSGICMNKFSYYNKSIKYLIATTALWFICSIFQLL